MLGRRSPRAIRLYPAEWSQWRTRVRQSLQVRKEKPLFTRRSNVTDWSLTT